GLLCAPGEKTTQNLASPPICLRLFHREFSEETFLFKLGNKSHIDKIFRLCRLSGRHHLRDICDNCLYPLTADVRRKLQVFTNLTIRVFLNIRFLYLELILDHL